MKASPCRTAAVALLVLIAITTKSTAQTDTRRPPFTAADVHFIQGMITHHAQALVMAALVPTHTSRDDLLLFAKRIEVSQQDEIAAMRRWLESHHQPVQDMDAMHHDSAGMMEMLMPGMLTAHQLAQLSAAQGPAFDELFLRFMIQHHEGALTMVSQLFGTTGAGQDAEMFRFASEIESDQQAEIMRMRAMLAARP
jgi:uncharacterized protein (DUF305 family)